MADGDVREKKKRDGDKWCTPPEIWSRALWGGSMVLYDPFPNEHSSVPAHRESFDADGFTSEWIACRRGIRGFVNPPFSRTGDAVRKCVEEWMCGCEIVTVLPALLNTSYWDHIDRAPATCRPFRRVSFEYEGVQVRGNRSEIVIVYWGADPWRFRESYRDYGNVRFG